MFYLLEGKIGFRKLPVDHGRSVLEKAGIVLASAMLRGFYTGYKGVRNVRGSVQVDTKMNVNFQKVAAEFRSYLVSSKSYQLGPLMTQQRQGYLLDTASSFFHFVEGRLRPVNGGSVENTLS